jgi:hypothetical protein
MYILRVLSITPPRYSSAGSGFAPELRPLVMEVTILASSKLACLDGV